MADNKKYYYMRLKENFFDTDEMIYLEGLEEGYLFSNILLKLYLRSLKNDGVLMMNSLVPYDAKMIARFTNHSLSTVEKALFEFRKLGLIEMLDSGQMYMSNIELFVGKTTTEADRKRLGRMKVEQKLIENKEEGQMSDKCPPELELELELELENNTVTSEEVTEFKQSKSEIIKEQALRVYEFYIGLTNSRIKPSDTNLKEVIGRLRDNELTEENCYEILKYKYAEAVKTKNFKYFTLISLFRKANSANTMQQIELMEINKPMQESFNQTYKQNNIEQESWDQI